MSHNYRVNPGPNNNLSLIISVEIEECFYEYEGLCDS